MRKCRVGRGIEPPLGVRPRQNGVAAGAQPDRFTMMPYQAYAHMTDYDMEAIFAYLMTRPALNHKVEAHPGTPKRDEP